MLFIFINK